METEQVPTKTKLDEFIERNEQRLEKEAIILEWHIKLHKATGTKLPWEGDDTYIFATQRNEEGDIDVEATRLYVAKIVDYAASQHMEVKKPDLKKEDTSYNTRIFISENPRIWISYVSDRETMCTPKVVGRKFLPATMTPARMVDDIEWECEPVSFLKIAREHNPIPDYQVRGSSE